MWRKGLAFLMVLVILVPGFAQAQTAEFSQPVSSDPAIHGIASAPPTSSSRPVALLVDERRHRRLSVEQQPIQDLGGAHSGLSTVGLDVVVWTSEIEAGAALDSAITGRAAHRLDVEPGTGSGPIWTRLGRLRVRQTDVGIEREYTLGTDVLRIEVPRPWTSGSGAGATLIGAPVRITWNDRTIELVPEAPIYRDDWMQNPSSAPDEAKIEWLIGAANDVQNFLDSYMTLQQVLAETWNSEVVMASGTGCWLPCASCAVAVAAWGFSWSALIAACVGLPLVGCIGGILGHELADAAVILDCGACGECLDSPSTGAPGGDNSPPPGDQDTGPGAGRGAPTRFVDCPAGTQQNPWTGQCDRCYACS